MSDGNDLFAFATDHECHAVMVILTRTAFQCHCHALIQALSAHSDNYTTTQQDDNDDVDDNQTDDDDDERPSSSFRLRHWQEVISTDSTSYLVHPPILVVVTPSPTTIAAPLSSSSPPPRPSAWTVSFGDDDDDDVDDDDDHHELEDDSDVQLLHMEDTQQLRQQQDVTIRHPEQHVVVTTQWSFSIVYSDTYRVPVLYFSVQENSNINNGQPCGRQRVLEVLQALRQRGDNGGIQGHDSFLDIPQDTWEFVSQEEHPITGLPAFFLHPCQSADRMKMIFLQSTDNDDASAARSNLWLWTWMSMILPAVGHSIPSTLFADVRSRLLGEEQTEEE